MLTPQQVDGLNVALNEAGLLEVEFDAETATARVAVLITVLTETGTEQATYWLELSQVSRLAVSLRDREDESAPVMDVTLDSLPRLVKSFDCRPVYGWQMVNPTADRLANFIDRLSLDWRGDKPPIVNVLYLFQDGFDLLPHDPRILQIAIWFTDITALDKDGNAVPIEELIAEGMAWWDAIYAGDSRTGQDEAIEAFNKMMEEL